MLLREWDPVLEVATLEELRIVDWGDVGLTPGDSELAVAQIAEQLAPIAASGTIPLVLGGDHLVALGELRALAATHGPLGLILLDSHADTWDSYMGQRFFHGTPFKRAVEEGLVDPSRSLLAGMRGTMYSPADLDDARGLGFEVVPWPELREAGAAAYGERARARAGDGPCFLSFDIDFVDPAYAPATGTPEVGGPTSSEALDLLRALRGIDLRGMDVVEVSPPYDAPGQQTSLARRQRRLRDARARRPRQARTPADAANDTGRPSPRLPATIGWTASAALPGGDAGARSTRRGPAGGGRAN